MGHPCFVHPCLPSVSSQARLCKLPTWVFHIWLNLKDAFLFPYTFENARDFIEMARTSPDAIYAIAVKGMAAGAIGLRFKSDVFGYSAEVGFWIGSSYQGKGIATEALRRVVREGFEKYNPQRIYAEVFEWNARSVSVLEKVGFTLGARPEKAAYKNLKMCDLLIYSLLNKNWSDPNI